MMVPSNQKDQFEIVRHDVHLTEKNFTMTEMFKHILPPNIDPPSSFEIIGHIAHLNLRAEHLPYRHQIGEIILKKCPTLRTVVNKVRLFFEEREFKKYIEKVNENDIEKE